MSITGLPGQGPVRAGIPVADLSAGLYAALGIMVALLHREHTGLGQWVQSSLLGAQIAMLDFQAARWLMAGEVPPQAGNNHPTSIPTGVFPTADGHINIAASGDTMWRRLCEAIGAPELLDEPDFADGERRSRNRDALNERLEARTRGFTSDALVGKLNEVGVPCGPIYAIDRMFSDPQVQHLGMAHPLHHPQLGDTHVVGQAVKLSSAGAVEFSPSPGQGEHTDAVLGEFGFTAEEIGSLRGDGVV